MSIVNFIIANIRRKWPLFLLGIALLIWALSMTRRPPFPGLPHLAQLPNPQARDRILILAPHEDDESLGTGGIIQRALAVGAHVKIAFLTYGDHNELAFMVYKKTPLLTPDENRAMGELRRQEALAATRRLGVAATNLYFLGFPDLGTLPIWEEYWQDDTPFYSLLINTNRVPYPDAHAFQMPFSGESIVAQLESILREFKPTAIFVTHPADGHPDHRALFLYAQVSLLNAADQIPRPLVFCYPIHAGPWPIISGYHPNLALSLPERLGTASEPWFKFELTPEEVAGKNEAICTYKSQMADAGDWMQSFARKNELFEYHRPFSLAHGALQSTTPAGGTEADRHQAGTTPAHTIRWAANSTGLVIRITLANLLERNFGLFLHAYGYRHDLPFQNMPKLNLFWTPALLRATDQRTPIAPSRLMVEEGSNIVTFVLPWSLLRQPDLIFVEAHGLAGDLRVSQTRWIVLTQDPPTPEVHP